MLHSAEVECSDTVAVKNQCLEVGESFEVNVCVTQIAETQVFNSLWQLAEVEFQQFSGGNIETFKLVESLDVELLKIESGAEIIFLRLTFFDRSASVI